ncbi:hypothetical protein LCGC14_0563490 [marine sediment metagenome]|uniref:Type II secretion system protein GspG C-terminal domain-containing protein n=1 Tax=marine sediment metagenome TaxID=412755 RepID=A0A0F9U7U5_9ZZZZ|nr:MAG: hypothetical protein Lokiarch_50480 [Candidatus Lokiarchaeum sp. GC14_75]HEA70376.1 hypothetical protein [archaeon]
MTNLIEKVLLLGFSIFLLTILTSLLIPLFGEVNEFNKNVKRDLEFKIAFINEIDQAVLYAINNPKNIYLKNVEYPSNFNITFLDSFIIFDFLIENNLINKILMYNTSFYNRKFHDFPPQTYLLNITYQYSYLVINLIEII